MKLFPRPLRLAIAACTALAGVAAPAPAQLTVRVDVPATTPGAAPVFIAGTFNGWNPGAEQYRLSRRGDGSYEITLPASVRGAIEFKFTLGSWDAVEVDAAGANVDNRRFTVAASGAAVWTGTVARWRDPRQPPAERRSTRTASVSILSDAFDIPQLGRTRRAWIYLPPDYATSTRRYPVLYMHDGQNLFDEATGYAGEWGVDETLDSLFAAGDPGTIVVAVDHGGERRMDEYSPWRNTQYGGGEGEAYVAFLVYTLKPWIDARYRTLPDRLNTGVAGSSMGGLISLFAILAHGDVFGRAAVFSPSFWFSDSTYAQAAGASPRRPDPRIYVVTGAREGDRPALYLQGHERMLEVLEDAGFRPGRELAGVVRADGTHSEGFWRREFPAAYLWLFRR